MKKSLLEPSLIPPLSPFYIRSTSKDGLLLYLGPDGIKIEGKEDWMSLELINGKVVYKYDLGSGPASIVCCQDHDFADGEWHQIRAER